MFVRRADSCIHMTEHTLVLGPMGIIFPAERSVVLPGIVKAVAKGTGQAFQEGILPLLMVAGVACFFSASCAQAIRIAFIGRMGIMADRAGDIWCILRD